MRIVTLGMTTALLLLAASAGNTQETLLDHLVDACKTDIENYCSQVTPGEGRMLHCMAAHEDKISGRCEYAFYQAATLLEQVSAAVLHNAVRISKNIAVRWNWERAAFWHAWTRTMTSWLTRAKTRSTIPLPNSRSKPARALARMQGHRVDSINDPAIRNVIMRGIALAGKRPYNELTDYVPEVQEKAI